MKIILNYCGYTADIGDDFYCVVKSPSGEVIRKFVWDYTADRHPKWIIHAAVVNHFIINLPLFK